MNNQGSLWEALSWLIEALPGSVVVGSKAPALLKFIYSLSKYSETLPFLISDENVIKSIIVCASKKSEQASVTIVIEIISSLLDYNSGSILIPYVEVKKYRFE